MRGRHVLPLLLLAAATPAWAQTPVEVHFVSPRHLATVVGPTRIEVRIVPDTPEEVEEIVLRVDGEAIARLVEPPYTTVWDAGEGAVGHRIEAVVRMRDGRGARAAIRTSPLRVQQYEEVVLVNVYAVVRDSEGHYVTDLGRDDFAITENGRVQTIDRFSAERKPLTVGIVLDTSLTMKGEKLQAAKTAALGFLDVLHPGDQGVVVAFSDEVEVIQTLTPDTGALAAAIESTTARGGTALYDAIWRTARHLRELEGRRVLVLLSDGRDEAGSGLEPGSLHTADEAIDEAARNEVMIFAIGLGKSLASDARRLESNPRARVMELDFYRREALAAILMRMATTTGGRALFSSRPGKLARAFEEVAADLRHQYYLGYVPDDPRRDGRWREIGLSTKRPGLTVSGRRGYFAPRD